MTKQTRKKKTEILKKIRKSQENEVNLTPSLPETSDQFFLGFKLKNVNQLWNWRTLEDVKF